MKKKIVLTIASVVAITAFIILPDFIFGLMDPAYLAGTQIWNVIVGAIVAVLIVMGRSKRIGIFILIAFFILQATELIHFRYFGVFYSAFDVKLFVHEYADTAQVVGSQAVYLLAPAAVSAALFIGALAFYLKTFGDAIKIRWISFFLVIALLWPLGQSLNEATSQKFQPNVTQSSLKNGLYSISYYIAFEMKEFAGLASPAPHYKPYVVTTIQTKKPNIIILLGESTSYLHMGIFGYQRNTTPDLRLFENDPHYFQTLGISSAVSTRVSLPLFYNIVYEPNNVRAISLMRHSLYRLAKDNGYATYYITTQKNAGGLTYAFYMPAIDFWEDDRNLKHDAGHYDNRLLLEVKRIAVDYSKPTFMTLHMRSAHGPYIDDYPATDAYYHVKDVSHDEKVVNAYDNAIHYTQHVIAALFTYFQHVKKPTYIFYIPDHGEMMGENGYYGHNTLKLAAAQIPILFYGVNIPVEQVKRLKKKLGCLTNHYIVGKEIARLMGYEITNPNQEKNIYYLNGVDVFGQAGFLKYNLHKQRKHLCENTQAVAHLLRAGY